MFDDLTLAELFAAADAIGNPYQTDEEREEFAARYLSALEDVEDVLAHSAE